MNITETLSKIKKERELITLSLQRISDLEKEIENAIKDDWEWIPVKKASELFSCSVGFIYERIKLKEIEVRYFGSKMMVSVSDMKKIDDNKLYKGIVND